MIALISTFESLEHRLLFATADLRVTNVIVPPGMIAYSGTFGTSTDLSVEIELHNAGTTTYDDRPSTQIKFSSDTSFEVDVDPYAGASLGTVTLAPGETKRYKARDLYADDLMDAGNYFLQARVLPFPDGFIGELNPADNFFAVTGASSVQIVTRSMPGAFISGTAGRDVIELRSGHPGGFALFATVNGLTRRVPAEWERVFVDAGDGNDVIRVAPTDQGHRLTVEGERAPIQITGSTGHDSISGGAGDEELSGGVGIDRIYGGGGNDFLLGGGHNDYLNGEAGNDLMIGGGGNDRLVDEVGRDHFIGGAGNDVLLSRDVRQNVWNNPDTLSGGTGLDGAQVDTTPSADNHVSIEDFIA